jgi:GAF domain-containing protein
VPDEQERDVLRRLDDIERALSQLANALASEEDIGRVMQRSVGQVAQAIPAAAMVSVSVVRDGTPETVATSDERVWAIDSDQYAAGEGPCLEAAHTGKIVRADSDTALARWPTFSRGARVAGVASFLSAPLTIDQAFAGSLNLYSEQVHGFDDLDEKLVQLYTTAAVAAIANARRYAEMRTAVANLRLALDSRAVIDQALGVLMVTHKLDADQAFQVLTRESQNTNTKLRSIASHVLENLRREQESDQPRPRA